MAKINIKQPKYILPLVILPFIFVIAYAIRSFSKDNDNNDGMVSRNEINNELQDPVTSKTGSKIDALRDRFRKEGDFTGIQNVDAEGDQMIDNSGSLYETDEMVYIDSINQISKIKEEEIKRMTQRYVKKDYTSENDSVDDYTSEYTQAKNQNYSHRSQPNHGVQQQDSTPEQRYQAAYQREYEKIQKQMRSIDSIRESSKHQEKIVQEQKQENQSTNTETVQENQNGKTSLVYKSNTKSAFNTLSSNDNGGGIVAMLDETVTVQGNSRIRIRLLEDVAIENVKLKNGDYLYGIVSGINGQRVIISINSIMVKGKIYKVDLTVYDNDGMEGFFIPDNYFRQLTKEIGASAVSQTNFTFENATETWQSLMYKTLNNIIRQLGNTISNTIRQQKATLKYNTQIYLYNKNEN